MLKTRIDNIIKIRFDIKQRFSDEVETDVISLAHSKIDIELISKIKSIPFVLTAFEVKVGDLKSKENLLF